MDVSNHHQTRISEIVASIISDSSLSEIREDALESLIEISLCLYGKGQNVAAGIDKIKDTVKYFTGLEVQDFKLQTCLAKLVQKQYASENKGIYQLTTDRYAELNSRLNENKAFVNNIFNTWLENNISRDPDLSKYNVILVEMVKSYLSLVIEYYSKEPLKLFEVITNIKICELPKVDIVLGKFPGIKKLDEPIKSKLNNAIMDFFVNPDKDRIKYITTLIQNNFELELQTINIDTDELLSKLSPNNITIYLDTNVAFSLIGLKDDKCKDFSKFINTIKLLGVKTIISARTKKEMISVLDGANSEYHIMCGPDTPNKSQVSSLVEAGIMTNNIFIRQFLAEVASGVSTSWNHFCSKWFTLINDLSKFNIVVEQIDTSILVQTNFERLKTLAGKYAFKSEPVREHDAYHYVLIQKKRHEFEIPQQCWFLTTDTSLTPFDKEARSEDEHGFTAFCMSPLSFLLWLNKITFSKISTENRELLSQTLISSMLLMKPRVNSSDIIRLMAVTNDWENMPPTMMVNIATELYISKRHRKERPDDHTMRAVEIDMRLTAIAELVGQRHLQAKDVEYSKATQEFRKRVEKLEEETKKLKSDFDEKERSNTEKANKDAQLVNTVHSKFKENIKKIIIITILYIISFAALVYFILEINQGINELYQKVGIWFLFLTAHVTIFGVVFNLIIGFEDIKKTIRELC